MIKNYIINEKDEYKIIKIILFNENLVYEGEKKFKNYYYLSNLHTQDFKKNKITINPEDSLICMGKISKLNN